MSTSPASKFSLFRARLSADIASTMSSLISSLGQRRPTMQAPARVSSPGLDGEQDPAVRVPGHHSSAATAVHTGYH
ncbi:hypothetical protein G7Z17_g13054 [Cylindrodendrum hubeiense]|uniref:Uncharacterized protein n=1 Tax=Cylindrodendrum hubeiense TaxID=595255 RepID=A0A9P5GSX7_9HYPO|nr:hypothetical protein G7Z17_g13054 [Cylindrodendrum hubeiense]